MTEDGYMESKRELFHFLNNDITLVDDEGNKLFYGISLHYPLFPDEYTLESPDGKQKKFIEYLNPYNEERWWEKYKVFIGSNSC